MAIDTKIANIVKSIAYTENNGQPDLSNPKAGASGEMKSTFQFLPETWREWSTQASGQKDLPMTPENEAMVTYHKVGDWLNNGYTPEQIFSMWNSGRPNAYKQGLKGTNSKGIKYDTPAYVKKATNYLKQFQDNSGVATSATKNTQNVGGQVASSGMISKQPIQPITQQNPGLITPGMKQARQV